MAFALSEFDEIITRIKDIIPEIRGTTSNDRLRRGINDAIRFVINENTSRTQRFQATVATNDLPAGGLVDLPLDFVALDSVWRLNEEGRYEKSHEAERADLLEFDSVARSYDSGEYYHAFRGSYIDTRPALDAVLLDGIRINYYFMDEDRQSGDTLSVFLERWRELLAYYVARKEAIRTEDERRELHDHFALLLGQYRRASRRAIGQPRTMGSVRGKLNRQTRRFGRIG